VQAVPPPSIFVDESGQSNLDVTKPDVGTHFFLTAIIIQAADVDAVRAGVEQVRAASCQTGELRGSKLGRHIGRYKAVLSELNRLPYHFYALAVDKREIGLSSGLAFRDTFHKFMAGQLFRRLFQAFPNARVVADEFGRQKFMDGFASYLVKNYALTLFDQPKVTFANSKAEPLVQLADVVCGAVARSYDKARTTRDSAALLQAIRPKALLIDEWPIRYRATTGNAQLLLGDPADDSVAEYSFGRAADYVVRYEDDLDERRRAQVAVLRRLVFELNFGDRDAYIPTHVLADVLKRSAVPSGTQWLRANVIARLRDEGVLIASSKHGYKIPVSVRDVADFVAITDTVVHPMLHRVAAARAAIRTVTHDRVDVLGGERLAVLRAAVEAAKDVPRALPAEHLEEGGGSESE
jgi:hypothetical protein